MGRARHNVYNVQGGAVKALGRYPLVKFAPYCNILPILPLLSYNVEIRKVK